MSNTRRLSSFIFLIAILLTSNLHGQRVGAVEKTNYPSLVLNDFNPSNRYIIALRDLFEQKDGVWSAVYNLIDQDSGTLAKYKTNYLLQNGKQIELIQGISYKQDRKSHLTCELFRVSDPPSFTLAKLPKTILKGFELNDIIASRIVSDTKVQRLDKELFRVEPLNDTLKNIVYDTLMAQCKRCFERCDDTTFFLAIKRSFIEDHVRLITGGLKLGKITIPTGNACYADHGTSYGGGILNYIIFPNQEVKLLVTNTELLDVGDYDNDGNFEYIFFKSWFNNYGYVMYYDNFERRVVNDWSYH